MAWDLLNEDCSDISDWIDSDAGNGVSEVSPAGQFRMDGNAADVAGGAYRQRDIGEFPNVFTAEIKLYHDKLGTFANTDYFVFRADKNDVKLIVVYATDGLFVYDGASYNEVGIDLVKHGGSAEWQTWRFVIDMTVAADATVDIYLTDSTHENEKVGSAIDCSVEGAYPEGIVHIVQYCRAVNDQLAHIDYVKITTGEYPLLLAGSIGAESGVTGNLQWLQELAGLVEAQSVVLGDVQSGYKTMPPAMLAALIDPYSGGAWIWLVEISIPGYGIIRYARDKVDITYAGSVFSKNNFDVGLASLSGDGSVPRIVLKVAQDKNHTLEDIVNATQGGSDGEIRIIRAHENFFDDSIQELEQLVDILTADSDTKSVNFLLGIPNPLLKKIPLRRYSSKICPWALPGLFKGLECQYVGEDETCTGKYTDCLAKGNEIHWGSELGLDPVVART